MPVIDIKFSEELVDQVCNGLEKTLKINKLELLHRINTEGALETAIFYGSKIDSYRYHQLAGRIGYKCLLLNLGSSIEDYLKRIGSFLRTEVYDYIRSNAQYFQTVVTHYDQKMSNEFDYLQFMSHYTSYLSRDEYNGKVIETPAQMHLRVTAECFYRDELQGEHNTIGVATSFITSSLEQYFSMASPVLFNSGFKDHNLSSCFLMSMEDGLEEILETIKRAGIVSKGKGGIGMDISNIRHSDIARVGMSKGIVPMLQIVDSVIRYVDQMGKRAGACTAFLQAHHCDVLEFIDITRKTIAPHLRVESLNTAIVFPSLFWKRLEKGEKWTLFCPHKFPGLNEAFGEDYDALYLSYEKAELSEDLSKYRKSIKAETLISMLGEVQIMSGMPYVIHKDNINYKSNRVNMDSSNPCHRKIIKNSNLCLEIYEQSSHEEVACCNLGQMSLPRFVDEATGEFDFTMFAYMVRKVSNYLNRIIDNSKYPLAEASSSNFKHRPVGLGVSGYADALSMMKMPYESKEAEIMNKKIFACMYFNSLVESLSLAIRDGPYETFDGSPLSLGKFQFDLWKEEYPRVKDYVGDVRREEDDNVINPEEWGQKDVIVKRGIGFMETDTDIVVHPTWDSLRQLIMIFGVRNCQRTAIMPSASTSRLMSNTECIEAHQECIYVRNFTKHSMVIINKHMQFALEKLGLWSVDVAEFIVSEHGSIQRLPEFLNNSSTELKKVCDLFKTMFEIKQRVSFTHTAHRHRYIDQGISANVYFARPTLAMLKNFHLLTWKLGINTGMYYLRSSPGGDASNFSISSQKVRDFVTSHNTSSLPPPKKIDDLVEIDADFVLACKRNDPGCTSCSS